MTSEEQMFFSNITVISLILKHFVFFFIFEMYLSNLIYLTYECFIIY